MVKRDTNSEGKSLGDYRYRGASMFPTFKPGQVLYVRPKIKGLSVGDVIVYYDQHKEINVVHRVVKIEGKKIYTRGDNNPNEDPLPINLEDVFGVVALKDDWGSIEPVSGGDAGLRHLRRRTLRNKFITIIKKVFYPVYHLVKISGIVPKLWHPKIQRIRVKIEDDKEIVKYIHGKRTVAIWELTTNRFSYRHPYDLVVKIPVGPGQ